MALNVIPYLKAPTVATPVSTAGAATSSAIAAGNQAYQGLPGYNASIANVGQNIQDETAGKLPADVIAEIQQQGAERGIATGTSGSANSNAAYLRSLGLNSLNLTNLGQNNLTSILPTLPGAAISQNPNFQPTTEQAYEGGVQQNVFDSAAASGNLSIALAQGGAPGGGGRVTNSPNTGINLTPRPSGPNVQTNAPTAIPTGNQSTDTLQNILNQYDPANINSAQSQDYTGGTGTIEGVDYQPDYSAPADSADYYSGAAMYA